MSAPTPSPEVTRLAEAGQTIAAIKQYRKETGAGLAKAKAVVDSLGRGNTTPGTKGSKVGSAPPSAEVVRLAKSGQAIAAIKRYRQETGAGLAAAKAAVDALPRDAKPTRNTPGTASTRSQASARGGFMLAALLFGLVGTAITATGLVRSHLAAGWPEAPGEIISSRHVRETNTNTAQVAVVYTFDVDGERFEGSRISYALIWGPWLTDAMAARYPPGTPLTVHYHPKDPSRSVIDSRPSPFYWLVFVLSLAALAWGIRAWRTASAVRGRSPSRP